MSNTITEGLKGKVKFFNKDKGYGFIIDAESKKEYFVHINNVKNTHELLQDDEVSFDIVEGKKGDMAGNVRVAE